MQNTDNRQVQVYLDGEEYIVYLLPERGDMTYFGTFLHEGVLAFGESQRLRSMSLCPISLTNEPKPRKRS
jgi:hypothetical protein